MDTQEFTPGRFCWVELATSDDGAAAGFYSELFGWKTQRSAMGEGMGDYTMLRRGEQEIGGLYELMADQKSQGVPPHWLSYVGVADVDASTAKAKELGATAIVEPMDVMDIGRMAVVQDPAAAVFALWQPKTHTGCPIGREPGNVCWNELITRDTSKAGAFYAQLFDWTPQEMPMGEATYTMFMAGGMPVAGMMAAPPEMGEAPPNWMVYFSVADCDGDTERAQTLGAGLCAPPMDVPDVGRMAVLTDPQGAAFAIIRLNA